MIEKVGEKGSGISVLMVQHVDDDDEMMSIIRDFGGARGVRVIVVGNEHGDTSSNPRRN